MGDLPRWASRFQFTRELWSDADRLLLDPALERALASGELAAGEGPVYAELATALLPHDSRGPRTFFLAQRGRRVAEYARQRGGAVFADLQDGVSLVGDEAWSFAQIDLTGLLEEDHSGGETPLDDRLTAGLAAVVETLGELADEGRTVVLSVPSRDAMDKRGVSEEVFSDFLAQHFAGARLYGLADAPTVGVFDFGEVDGEVDEPSLGAEFEDEDDDDDEEEETTHLVRPRTRVEALSDEARYDADLDAAERTWVGEHTEVDHELAREQRAQDDAGDTDDLPIDFDNSIGSIDPRYFAYLAIVGASDLPAGLTLIELPAPELGAESGSRGHEVDGVTTGHERHEAAGLRAQLAQAQRQADILAVERQALVERLDESQERVEELEDALEETIGEGASGPGGPLQDAAAANGSAQAGERVSPEELVGRLDAALAREQELRWRVQSLNAQLEGLAARPIHELEAKVAHLQARLAAQSAAAHEVSPVSGPATQRAMNANTPAGPIAVEHRVQGRSGRADRPRPSLGSVAGHSPALDASVAALRIELDALMRRVERGGFNGLELHRLLKRLRDRLGARLGRP